jgi:flagellar hook-basal body complex protein FliE
VTIPPISSATPAVSPLRPPSVAETPSGSGFGAMIERGLEAVSASEQQADALIQKLATGQDVQPHEVMIATSKAQLSVQLTVAVRDAALAAYREVMNLQL